MDTINPLDIAVVGMSCYFPEAYDLKQYWHNLSNGICSVRFYSEEELVSRGVDKRLAGHPDYVKASPYFERTKYFDASFFNINPGEANIMDPQRRVFIENCWQALEDAGYVPEKYTGKIGVFGSTGMNFYMMNIMDKPELVESVGALQLISSNDKDGLPTQVSYLLNLTGPSVNVNTACSSTLVAIHLARQALLFGDADMVLAGGAALIVPENVGYFHEKDSILSHDGYCRAFDDASDGTIWGSGSGVVVLKRLSDAVADGDTIRAVIKGSAINNDGAEKVGYTAPSIEGQSEVIVQAYASSEIPPDSVRYIEAHGTGTKIGDPIEVAALTKAFREFTDKKNFCGLSSVKTNFGHLGAAAGIASFIKAVLALENKKIPPTLHFKTPNKNIDFENSPFYVATELTEMVADKYPLRVGVSSLGVGGTNAHIILEETPAEFKKSAPVKPGEYACLFSARTPEQLERVKANMRSFLQQKTTLSLCDVAYTLQKGRRDFVYKTACLVHSMDELIAALAPQSGVLLDAANCQEKLAGKTGAIPKKLSDWFAGQQVEWDELYKGMNPKRVALPTYPFTNDSYWIEATSLPGQTVTDNSVPQKKSDLNEWLYCSKWYTTPLPVAAAAHQETKKRLLFVDQYHIGEKIGRALESLGDTVVFVYPGKSYVKKGVTKYELNNGEGADFELLFRDLAEDQLLPDSIIYCPGLNTDRNNGFVDRLRALFEFQKDGLFAGINLVKGIIKNTITRDIELILLVNNIFDIRGNERILPEKSSLISITKVVQQEYPHFHNRLIEIDIDEMKKQKEYGLLVNEIAAETGDLISAYRGDKRWTLGYSEVALSATAAGKSVFKKNGVYFLFGGLTGGMPFIFEYLMDRYQAHLILIDDPYFPAECEWDRWLDEHSPNEINSLKIKTIKKLKARGVEYIDTIDFFKHKEQLEKKIRELEAKFGKIDGVIHAAGGYAAGRIAPLSIAGDDLKNMGMYNLASIGGSFLVINELFKKRTLDFRFLWTSLSTVLAGPTFASYCAADSIAAYSALEANRELSVPWSIVNWDSLEAEWFEELVEENMARGYQYLQERIEEGLITTDEGNRALELAASTGNRFNPVIISCSDLHKRYDIWVKMENAGSLRGTNGTGMQANIKERPELAVVYEAPQSPLEKSIAEHMSALLFIEKVGRNDNFFDLGGNSVIAIQFASKIREIAQVDFGMDKLFENQTVAEIAAHVVSLQK